MTQPSRSDPPISGLCTADAPLIRPPRRDEAQDLARMISQLAAYHGDTATVQVQDLYRDVFSPDPWVWMLVAEQQGQILGYTALYRAVQLHFGQRFLEMHHLFVLEKARGMRVGVALIDGAKALARDLGCRRLTVGTDPDNLKAQGFYLSQGFQRRPSFPPRFAIPVAD